MSKSSPPHNYKLQNQSDLVATYDPLVDQDIQEDLQTKASDVEQVKLSSPFQSYMNSIKVFLGNIYLTIPNVFTFTGWMGGITLYSLVALLNTYTMITILEVAAIFSQRPNEKGVRTEVKSYTDLSERIHGQRGKIAVMIFMFIVQFSCCVGYLYFVAGILEAIICDQAGYCDHVTMYKYLMMIPTIPICLIKSYTGLSYVSIGGISCATLGGLLLIGYCSEKLVNHTDPSGTIKIFDIVQFFGYVGIAMFSFEGNGVVINLKAASRDKLRYPKHLMMAMLTVIIFYMCLATVAYYTYKSGSAEYITSNLSITGFTIFLRILFSINAISSYPLQILCLFEIIEDFPFFSNKTDSVVVKNVKLYTERVLMIFGVTIAAIVIPRFVDFLNIAGSLGASVLAFILPPIYYLQTLGVGNLPRHIVAFNVGLIGFGIFGAIFSIVNSILKFL